MQASSPASLAPEGALELVEVLFDGLSNRYAVWRSGSSRLICFVDSQEDADEVADVCAVKIALERGIPLESVAFKNEGALHDILPGLEVPDTVAASAQHAAARPDSLTPATAHSTPAAAAQAVGAAAAAAAAQGTPERSKRPAQAAGLSPRGGGKQQRVDLLLGIGSGLLPSAAQAEQQKAGQPRHCRVCSSGSPGPYASACWHRHPETKEEWLCHPCYGKALRQFRKKQAQQGQNQPAAQQPAGAPAPATAAVVAAQPEAAPPLSEQQPQQAAQAQVHAQKGTSAELRHAYLQQVFMRLPYELQWMHHDEVVDMQGEQAWDLLRQFIADEVALVERQRGGGIGGGPLGASPGDASGGSVPGR
ncbi:hypothetical protein COHA_002064 [Chlorella ohadii]|uniref:Uncharacterized protein n=1 Tax=Chlorella ohadii TaxID=2649997 RepID=A0AAD5H555_9CHLO|nr:hypothetical protein COHA_002064 [Chlorella ohadii]